MPVAPTFIIVKASFRLIVFKLLSLSPCNRILNMFEIIISCYALDSYLLVLSLGEEFCTTNRDHVCKDIDNLHLLVDEHQL